MKYKNIKQIGDGGFCDVFLCEDENGKRFAKKVLRTTDQDSIDRFTREARLIREMRHPYLIPIVAIALTNSPPWFVMPLCKGTLDAEVPNLPGDDARINALFRKILDAVAYIHEEGVVHRDLKPKNILFDSDDDIFVSDFGLGRRLDSESTRYTASGEGAGSPKYMAPEQQADFKKADKRSDIYSLGRILFEFHTGKLRSVATDTNGLPSGLAMVIDKCVETDPDNRYQSIAELRHAWMVVTGQLQTGSIDTECSKLAETLKTGRSINKLSDEVGQLFDILLANMDNEDLIRETIIELPGWVVDKFVEKNRKQARALMRTFAENCMSQGWPFSYTDSIGAACNNIFNATQDHEVRSLMTVCAADVGAGHNRYYVEGIGVELFETKRDAVESLALSEHVKKLTHGMKAWVRERVTLSKLDKSVLDALKD